MVSEMKTSLPFPKLKTAAFSGKRNKAQSAHSALISEMPYVTKIKASTRKSNSLYTSQRKK